jgi:uncharacterized repeat protein (TIGR01451 family)
MNKLTQLIRRAPKRFSALALIIAAAVIIPTAALAWGPSRTVYHWAGPAADHVVFNSFVDNPVQGDERNFMQVREINASNTTYADSISVQADHTYVVNMYYHNNASTTLNDAAHNYAGIAHGAYVKAQIPGVIAKGSTGTQAEGYIGAANASPAEVYDEVAFANASGADIALNYVPGSTTLHNFGKANGQTMSDSIVSTGAPIGYDSLNGDVPGCNEFSGYVTFEVKATQSNFTIQKQVRVAGQTTYQDNVTANAGDTLEYRIQYVNTGSIQQNNVVIKDTLPAHVSYIAGSTTLKNITNPNGKSVSDGVTTTGINIGSYTPGSNAYVKFSAKIDSATALLCGTNTLVNKATVQVGTDTKDSTATTTVNKDCPPAKITVCQLSDKTIVTINESDFNTTKYSKNLDDCKTPGTINVCQISTKTIVNIKESDFNASKYTKDLSVCTPVTPPVTPPQLPRTGMSENIVAVIGLGAITASAAYYIASRRALLNQ